MPATVSILFQLSVQVNLATSVQAMANVVEMLRNVPLLAYVHPAIINAKITCA